MKPSQQSSQLLPNLITQLAIHLADLVSLTDENRTFVKMGLQMIQTGDRIGLDVLLQEALNWQFTK
jgi:hypothetical protein